jgi:glycosyltransferase involved in cell wall biosynthesis
VHFVFTTLGYHPESIGGAFRYVAAMAEGLARRGHAVEAIFPFGQVSEVPATRNGVTLHRIKVGRGPFWRNWTQRNSKMRLCLREIRKTDPNAIIVSCHGYFAEPAMDAGKPLVSLFTGPWAEEFLQSSTKLTARLFSPAMRRNERIGLQRSGVIFTISRYYEENLRYWHPGLKTPVHVIDGGVDNSRFHPPRKREELRENFGVAPGEFVFLAVRRLEPRMGLAKLIDAFAEIQSEYPNARLWIAGFGPLLETLQKRVSKCNGRAEMLGFISDFELRSRYGAADCTVMPSVDLEGFGLSTVESLACGTPVIGSRQGATPEILEPLAENLLYKSPHELADKMRSILSGAMALPSREQCRNYAVTRYNWERPVEAFEKVCAKLFEGAP